MPSTIYQKPPNVHKNPGHPYWTADRGYWFVADELTDVPYPCACDATRRCRPAKCPCSVRVDHLEQMPTHCCARRTAETTARTEGR